MDEKITSTFPLSLPKHFGTFCSEGLSLPNDVTRSGDSHYLLSLFLRRFQQCIILDCSIVPPCAAWGSAAIGRDVEQSSIISIVDGTVSRPMEKLFGGVKQTSCRIVVPILVSTLTSVASDLFNYALRLDNELSARPPRGRHGLWTGLKTQMGCLQIVWWNQ